MRPRYYFTLGQLPGTPLTRYAIVAEDGTTVIGVQVSVPDIDLTHIDRPAHLRWRQSAVREVEIKRYRINEQSPRNGEQARRPTWSRAGKRAAAEVVA